MKAWIIAISLIVTSVCSSAEESPVKIVKLAPNVYQHISYLKLKVWGLVPASGLIYVDGKDAYLIDTPWTQSGTEQVVSWIKDNKLTLKAAVVSHYHQDASGGLEYLNALGVQTYAYDMTNDLLQKQQREQANIGIRESVFSLLDGKLEVFYPGGGHAQDNIVIWLPGPKVMFGGCFVKSAKSTTLGNLEDASVQQWADSIDRVLLTYPDIETLVPGHGQVGDKTLFEHTKQLVKAHKAKHKNKL